MLLSLGNVFLVAVVSLDSDCRDERWEERGVNGEDGPTSSETGQHSLHHVWLPFNLAPDGNGRRLGANTPSPHLHPLTGLESLK